MQFRVHCETFLRLANAATPVEGKDYQHAFCVRIEYLAGHAYAIATNSLVLAVQYLGEVSEPDGGVSIIPVKPLLDQCAIEASFNGELIVDLIDNEFMKFANLKSSFGFQLPGNAAYFPPNGIYERPYTELGQWRQLIPSDKVKKSKGFMFMDTEQLVNLGKASPSGRLVFPEFFDTAQPVIVRDAVDPEWLGIFLPREDKLVSSLTAATYPEWL